MLPAIIISVLISFSYIEILEANPGNYDRIVNGADTLIETIPFQVAIFPKYCGGSIISSRWVLTAAHCTEKYFSADEISFAVGCQDRRIFEKHNYYQVSKLVQHPNYNTNTVDNDIALLKASREIGFSKTVQPIKLSNIVPPDGALVTVSGYGATSDEGIPSFVLLSVQLNIFNFEKCNPIHSGDLTENMLCAYKENVDSCQGDSGGPLTYNGELVGVVSFGEGCGWKGYPGVYAKVANYVEWINNAMQTE